MKCQVVKVEGDKILGYAIVCSDGRGQRRHLCRWCSEHGGYQCDYPDKSHKSGTCDAWMCARHRTPAGHNIDHCPTHAGARIGPPKPEQLKLEL